MNGTSDVNAEDHNERKEKEYKYITNCMILIFDDDGFIGKNRSMSLYWQYTLLLFNYS